AQTEPSERMLTTTRPVVSSATLELAAMGGLTRRSISILMMWEATMKKTNSRKVRSIMGDMSMGTLSSISVRADFLELAMGGRGEKQPQISAIPSGTLARA